MRWCARRRFEASDMAAIWWLIEGDPQVSGSTIAKQDRGFHRRAAQCRPYAGNINRIKRNWRAVLSAVPRDNLTELPGSHP